MYAGDSYTTRNRAMVSLLSSALTILGVTFFMVAPRACYVASPLLRLFESPLSSNRPRLDSKLTILAKMGVAFRLRGEAAG